MNIYEALSTVAQGEQVRRRLPTGVDLCMAKFGPELMFAVKLPDHKRALQIDRKLSDSDMESSFWRVIAPGSIEWTPLYMVSLLEDLA